MTTPPDPTEDLAEDLSGTLPLANTRHEAFCREYLKDLNGAAAAKRVGYAEKSANTRAAALLRDRFIQARLEHLVGRLLQRHEVTVDRILTELAAVAYSDLTDVCTWGPEGVAVLDSAKLPPHVRAAVKKVKVKVVETTSESGGTRKQTDIEVEMHAKLQALDRLGEYKRMFTRGLFDEGTGEQETFRPVALLPQDEPGHTFTH